MSVVVDFPARISRRPLAAPRDAVTVSHRGDSLTFADPAEFWDEARASDPELKARLAALDVMAARIDGIADRVEADARREDLRRRDEAALAALRLKALRARAAAAIQREIDRRLAWAQIRSLLWLAAAAGVFAAAVVFAVQL